MALIVSLETPKRNFEMSLDEINAEIKAAREAKKKTYSNLIVKISVQIL